MHDAQVRAAVAGALEGEDGRGNGRVGVGGGGGYDVRGEGGVVTAAVLGVEHQAEVEQLGFERGVGRVLAHHHQDVLGGRSARQGGAA